LKSQCLAPQRREDCFDFRFHFLSPFGLLMFSECKNGLGVKPDGFALLDGREQRVEHIANRLLGGSCRKFCDTSILRLPLPL